MLVLSDSTSKLGQKTVAICEHGPWLVMVRVDASGLCSHWGLVVPQECGEASRVFQASHDIGFLVDHETV